MSSKNMPGMPCLSSLDATGVSLLQSTVAAVIRPRDALKVNRMRPACDCRHVGETLTGTLQARFPVGLDVFSSSPWPTSLEACRCPPRHIFSRFFKSDPGAIFRQIVLYGVLFCMDQIPRQKLAICAVQSTHDLEKDTWEY